MRLVWALALSACCLAAAGCGTPTTDMPNGEDPNMGGPKELPDGFVQTGCNNKADCDDGDPCTNDICQHSHQCSHTVKDCTALDDDCNKGTCDSTSAAGDCVAKPANESKNCVEKTSMAPGQCMTGVCSPVPQCYLDWSLGCSSFDATNPGTTSGTSALSAYTCQGANNLTGPEIGYPFSVTTDRMVTLSLTGSTVDHDLLVLEGKSCIANAACVAKSTTVGSGNESLTFLAKANTDYVIVIDGRAGAAGAYTLNIDCVGGTCKFIKTLTCNTSTMGNTTGANATNILSSYACNATTPGPEDSYRVTQTVDTNYKMKLSGLTTDLDMMITLESGGECDPTWCKASAIQTGTMAEEVSWQGYSGSVYDVHIDSKTATGGPYLLETFCPASCANTSNTISCSTGSVSGRNDDATKSKKVVDSWGTCAPNTTGPEVAYRFSPSVTGMYTFELSGLSADLDLVVMNGDYSTCDPTTACVTSSTNTGTTNESVTFMADSTKYYWIGIDGKNNAAGTYTLKIKSTSCPGASCYNSANELSCSYLEDIRKNDDAAHSKNVVDTWACDTGTTGPEVVYKFKPTVTGSYTATLDQLTADLDLIVVSNTSAFACDASTACVSTAASIKTGTTSETVTFTADATKTYYLAVDGKNGAVGNYHIKLTSTSCGAPICKNGIDSLSCSTLVTANRNDASGATNDVSSWGTCLGGGTGPEFAHLFSPTVAGPTTVEMIGLKADLDLIVLEAPASMCAPNNTCVKYSNNTGNTSEKVTFTADPAKKYWLIVDGKNGATSPYTLAVTDGCGL